MVSLQVDDFARFFEDVWQYSPFPWQTRLAHQVCTEGKWPELLDLPTGAGKTAAIDIALFHLAVDGGRTAPRRIVMVVDRRVVVDQVGERARALRSRLEHAPADSVTGKVAAALREIVGQGCLGQDDGEPLLQTAVLRGGTVRDTDWARYPHVPLLAASTVDQVGSRLLFRGYGLSSSMSSVHAGLLGCDTLLLLDEVHLAQSFAETLSQLQGLRARSQGSGVPPRFAFVQLSATPGVVRGDRFALDEHDRRDRTLQRRLSASKPADLQLVKVKGKDEKKKRAAVASAAVKAAIRLLDSDHRAIAIIVNRVDTARLAWEEAKGTLAGRADVELLTGRMRPLDQRVVVGRVLPRVGADRLEADGDRPIVLVATQCVEAGADLDFDGLVSECASLDALRQRFGRLARRGKDEGAEGVVLARSDQVGSRGMKEPDPVYGTALPQTWKWLQALGETVDFGITALEPSLAALGEGVQELLAPVRDTPVLMPGYLDQWVQTNPAPAAEPEVSLFLHGIPENERAEVADVQIVWRADVTEAALVGDRVPTWLLDVLRAVPPGSLEALSIPVWAARSWLRGRSGPSVADVEGAAVLGDDGPRRARPALKRKALLYRGEEIRIARNADDITPGCLLVVPASLGGIGVHGTWDPEPTGDDTLIADLGDAIQLLQRGRPTLRLDPYVLAPWLGVDSDEIEAGLAQDSEEISPADRIRESLAWIAQASDAPPAWLRSTMQLIEASSRALHVGDVANERWIATSRRRVAAAQLRALFSEHGAVGVESMIADLQGEGTSVGEEGSFTSVEVDLDDHLQGVGGLAEAAAKACHLPPELVSAVRWAGRLHDVGKCDPCFQRMLHGGDPVAAFAAQRAGRFLAKSALPWQSREDRRRARDAASYPAGQRHELVSLDMVERSSEAEAAVCSDGADWELVLHLVGSHHGWCRPFAPAVDIAAEDSDLVEWLGAGKLSLRGSTRHQRGRLGSGVVDRFWRLVERYGWYELAWLETFVRLADHRCSELGARAGVAS